VTTLRVWTDYYETGELDVQALRSIRGWAERLGLRLLLVLFSPARLTDIYEPESRFDLGLTPFNAICRRPEDVVREPAALDVLVARCRAILDVFGDSPALFAWELVNQTDDLYQIGTAEMADFIRRFADRVRAEDARVGATRLLTATSFQPAPPAWLLTMDELDFDGFHAYARSVHDPVNRVDGAVHVGVAIRYALAAQARPRPVLDTESGPIAHIFDPGMPRPDPAFRAELAHNLRWAHLAAGGAGTGLHISANDEGQAATRRVPLSRLGWQPLTGELASINAIARTWALAPGHGPVRNLAADLTTGPGVFGFASATAGRAIGWLLRDTRTRDLAADVERALAAGPTEPGTLDARLLALDAWLEAYQRVSLDPLDQYSRKAIGMLLRQGASGLRRAGELIDEGLTHLDQVTRQVAPGLLDAGDAAPAPAEVTLGGLADGRHRLRWVDDTSGEVVAEAEAAGPTIRAQSPPFDRHLAFVVTPADPVP
jgi:hypothetical protein